MMIAALKQHSPPLGDIKTSENQAASSLDLSSPSQSLASSTVHDPDFDGSESEESDDGFACKPRLPYAKGFTFTALRHEPPEPFGRGYITEHPPAQENWEALSQTDYCLACPPLEGQTHSEQKQTLTITSTIRTGYDRGAQLVVVNNSMVAKIYDPLYYNGTDECGYKEDVVLHADSDYSCEAAAYTQLQKSQGAKDVTPSFHGTWTIKVETLVGKIGQQNTHRRHVRLILMEWLRGESMDNVRAVYLRRPVRSLILKNVLHAEAIISNAGIQHNDFCPRNTVILSDDYDTNIPVKDIQIQVKVFDFNVATAIDHPRYHCPDYSEKARLFKCKWRPRLPSPILRHFGRMNEFAAVGWCSDTRRGPDKWMWKHFRNDERFVPVIWDPNAPDERPRYAEYNCMKDRPGSSVGFGIEADCEGEGSSDSGSAHSARA
ncbi:Nn.00g013850.m01.CDS01 [Neocucurbitaria sp. VM-36]